MEKTVNNKHQPWDLAQMQSLPLEVKVSMTERRIQEWYKHFDGNVYVSFSGGKDSTVLLHIARSMYPNIPAVFCDTGLEYPEIREFVKTIPNVTFIKPEMSFRKVIETYGYPVISKDVAQNIYESRINPNSRAASKFDPNSDYNKKYKGQFSLERWTFLRDSSIPISHHCCDVMKKRPMKKFERQFGLLPLTAVMACESRSRKADWILHGCNAFDKKRPVSQPMSFWLEQDVLAYLKTNNIPYCSVYGEIVESPNNSLHTTGCARTGCMFCMFGCHLEKPPNRFQRMKETHPKIYDYCMRSCSDGGLGLGEVLDFIHVNH